MSETIVLYDPEARQITLGVTDLRAVSYMEEDGVTLITFEGVTDIEFVWPPDVPMWRKI